MNTIKVIDQGENQGKLQINIGTSAFASKDIIVDVRDIKSVVSLNHDDLGEDDKEGNIVVVSKYICGATGKLVEQ